MQRTALNICGVCLASLLLGACGAQSSAGTPAASGTTRLPAGFKLSVLDSSFALGGSLQDVQLAVSAETALDIVVDINATGAQDLKALYLKLDYDPAQYHPLVVEPTGMLGDKQNLLSLLLPVHPGELQYGQTLVQPDYQLGFNGNGTLAQISFRKQAAKPVRTVSSPPRTAASEFKDIQFQGADKLTWSYASLGDYDQNGEVNVADLTPISQHFKEVSPDGAGQPFPFASAQSQIDGDGNGEINASDLLAISKNVGVDVLGGFKVFKSASDSDLPGAADAPNGAGAVELTADSLPVTSAVNAGAHATQRLTFEYTLSSTIEDAYYWVRPYDSHGNAGIASVLHPQSVQFPVGLAADAATTPESGSGLAADPYVLKGDKQYAFSLIDPVSGADLTADPGTQFNADPPTAGQFSANVLALDPGYDGDFVVSASYNGLPEGGDGGQIYCHAQSAPPVAPYIDKDPADPNWTGVTGTGADDQDPLVLHLPDPAGFNPDTDADGSYDLMFTLQATAGQGGPVIPNADLEWSSFPPFVPFDTAAYASGTAAGTFQVWAFSIGYLFAQDPGNPGLPGQSNNLYVTVHSLP